jgi:hypothetical protein
VASGDRALFDLDAGSGGAGERFVPTELCRGPWYPDTQHGSPMLGLLARAVEALPSERPMQVARLTVDLMRAAPLAPVQVAAAVRRAGKSVEFCEASLLAGGEEFARATAMRFRTAEVDVPDDLDGSPPAPPPLPDDDGGMGWPRRPDGVEAMHDCFSVRPVPGFETPTAWFRLDVPLVRGEAPSPLVRVAITSDFAYSLPLMRRLRRDGGESLMRRPFVSINADTTINLHRPPRGEWLCVDTRSHVDPIGAGTAGARLYDGDGVVGLVSQSLLVRGPESAPQSWKDYRGEIE